jgi:riboflavin kinase
MTVNSSQNTIEDCQKLAVLKALALDGGIDQEIPVVNPGLATRLELSAARVESLLSELEEATCIARRDTESGERIRLTSHGVDLLRAEYDDYRGLFDATLVPITGTVTDGMGEGKHYTSLAGYQRQFQEQLGYRPFPGTLNVEIDGETAARRGHIETLDGVPIVEWEDEERTYDAATCYSTEIHAHGKSFDQAHILIPDRTHHDDRVVEVIAPVKLRDALSLESEDEVVLDVSE